MKTNNSQSSKTKKRTKSKDVILLNSATLANTFKSHYYFYDLSNIKVRKSAVQLTQVKPRTFKYSEKNQNILFNSNNTNNNNNDKEIKSLSNDEVNIYNDDNKPLKTVSTDTGKHYLFNDMKFFSNNIKTEVKENEINDNRNNNISLYSTKWYITEPKKTPKIYYTTDYNIRKQRKKWNQLLKTSEKFNKYNDEKIILGKINAFKNQNITINNYKKFQQFSYKRSVPIKVAFGLGKSNNEIEEINNNYNFNKRLKQQRIKKISVSNHLNHLYKNGYNIKKEKGLNINKGKNRPKSSTINSKFITDSSLNKLFSKDSFGNEIYSVLTKHIILKNILPKDIDYNTKTSIDDIINSEIHPLLRHQKKFLAQNSALISQELNVLFSHYLRLCQMKKEGEKEEKIDLKINDIFIDLMKQILAKKEENNAMNNKEDNKEEEMKNRIKRRKYLLGKFKDVIILAYKKIKKFNIDINIFYSLMDYNKNDSNFQMELIENGQYLFKAIKAEDTQEIINVINKYNYLVAYKDDFEQIPLHICAKRNLYKLIYFLLSRLSSIDAQDLAGRTPLMIAAKNNFFEFTSILLFEGADPTIKDINNQLASEMTTNEKLRIVLKRAEVLNNLKYFIKGKNYQNFIFNGLDFLFKKELEIDYEDWIKEGKRFLRA